MSFSSLYENTTEWKLGKSEVINFDSSTLHETDPQPSYGTNQSCNDVWMTAVRIW